VKSRLTAVKSQNSNTGIGVSEGSQVTVADCEIVAHQKVAVAIGEASKLVMVRSKIHDGETGILVTEKSQGIVADCQIVAHQGVGVAIESESDVSFGVVKSVAHNKPLPWVRTVIAK
jgi:hypothetical protein